MTAANICYLGKTRMAEPGTLLPAPSIWCCSTPDARDIYVHVKNLRRLQYKIHMHRIKRKDDFAVIGFIQ